MPSKKRKSQVEPEEGRQEEAVEERQKAAKKAQNEGSKKQKQQPSKKSEYELEPDTDENEENQKNADADKEEGNDEEDIIKGLCPHAKFVLEKPLSTYPTGKDGKKELVKNARDALRDQMSFEGKNKAVSTLPIRCCNWPSRLEHFQVTTDWLPCLKGRASAEAVLTHSDDICRIADYNNYFHVICK